VDSHSGRVVSAGEGELAAALRNLSDTWRKGAAAAGEEQSETQYEKVVKIDTNLTQLRCRGELGAAAVPADRYADLGPAPGSRRGR
jgi:hypothetical protein